MAFRLPFGFAVGFDMCDFQLKTLKLKKKLSSIAFFCLFLLI